MRDGNAPLRYAIVNGFAFCAVPLACWQKWIFPFLPNIHLQHTFVYVSGIFMLWAWQAGFWSLADARALLRKALPWLAALFVLQTIACWHSASLYPVAGQLTAITVLIALAKLAAQIPFLFFFALLCSVLTVSKRSRHSLLAGAVAAFCVILSVCLVQSLVIYAKPVPWLSRLGHNAWVVNNALAPFLEAQWKDALFDFYHEGSYTATLARMNGVFEEASVLTSWTGGFFLPLALGLTAARSCWKYWGWAMFVLCLVILFASTSFTGVILGVAGTALAGMLVLLRKKKFSVFLCCLVLLSMVAGAAFFSPATQTKIDQWRQALSPRVVISLASLGLIAKNPVLGVGRGFFSAHVAEEEIYSNAAGTTDAPKDMELLVWKERGAIPHLSMLPADMAEYGIPLVLAAFAGFLLVFARLYGRLRQKPSSSLFRFSVTTYGCWLLMNFVAAFAILEIRNALFLLPLCCFYAVSRLEEESGDP